MLYQRAEKTVNLFGMDIPEPKILLDFLGFETHVKQIRDKRGAQMPPLWYDHASYYIVDLQPDKIFGPDEVVPIPEAVKAPDYEFEIGCLVTKNAVLRSFDEALAFFRDHCYLTILNDWSARDVQKVDMQGLGPTNSKFIIGNSIGPKLVPVKACKMDENGVLDMKMVLTVNGEERSNTNYNTLYHTHPQSGAKQAWSFPRIMAWLGAQNIGLEAGYIMGSGTVGNGCIAEFAAKVDPETGKELSPAGFPWLKDGDVVAMEVEGIGKLENKVEIKSYAAVK
ncbi:MAG: fumarylacetoacetate hydrolase family protein [Cyanobacteriota/Melainabacteria group bacterium]|nr:fumarylacetoacetate hydrolase family protein [Cyanobacteria bacterium HKST-UBA01]MCB9470380.1 fumarylacetoacetate hydrolase family protein [Candidatus Obscuribacterales bacterium]